VLCEKVVAIDRNMTYAIFVRLCPPPLCLPVQGGRYPFYVGIGRAERASDRLRYVKSLMVPGNAAKLARESLSVRVMASLLRRGVEIRLSCTRRPMNRREALDLERRTIARLVAAGFLLTNWQQTHIATRVSGELSARYCQKGRA
jgi:hypothetical protein